MNTIESIAADVVAHMSPAERFIVYGVQEKEEMGAFHHTVGQHIRNHYGLWREGHPLTKDGEHPDDVSLKVLKRVWEMVQQDEGRAAWGG